MLAIIRESNAQRQLRLQEEHACLEHQLEDAYYEFLAKEAVEWDFDYDFREYQY
jgi:hypothetical protein